MPRIVIIGKGKIGNAIADILRPKKVDIAFWDIVPEKLTEKCPLAEIVHDADFVFLCVPSFAVPQAVLEMKLCLPRRTTRGERNRTIVVSLSKGIEKKSGATMDELLRGIIPRFAFALLSGPMLAEELSQSKGGAAVVASKDAGARNAVARLFEDTELHVSVSADIHGVALAGILKNIYAIVLGATDGMGSGYNAKGFLFGTAQSEMAKIIPLLGGARETVGIPALVGDLFATGMSPASNNHTFGAAICSGTQCPEFPLFSEGVVTAPFIAKRLGARARRFPLFLIAVALVKRPKEGRKRLHTFLFGKGKAR